MDRRNFITGLSSTGILLIAGCTGEEVDDEAGFGDGEGIEQVLTLEDGSYSTMSISENGESIVTATTEEILLHDPNGSSRDISDGIINPNLRISDDGDHILTTNHGTVTVYDREGELHWQRVWEDGGSEIEVTDVGVSEDFQAITIGSLDALGSISFDDTVLWETVIPSGRIWEIDSSETGEYVVARTEERDDPGNEDAIHVVHDGDHIWSESYDEPPIRAAISDSSEIVAVGLDDGRLLVYDLEGELQWMDQELGGFFALPDNGDFILTHFVEDTVAFTPDGDELWRESEVGLWWYDLVEVSNSGRSIAAYEDPTENTFTVNVYESDGEIVWQETYESRNLGVNISNDGNTWTVNTRQKIDLYHDYEAAE